MKTKIEYTTPYADDAVNGYVMAEYHDGRGDTPSYYTITKAQYNRAVGNLTVAGAAPRFLSTLPVLVIGVDL